VNGVFQKYERLTWFKATKLSIVSRFAPTTATACAHLDPLVKEGPGLAHSRQLSKGAQRQLADDHSLMCRLCMGDSKGGRARDIHTIISGGRDRRISASVIAGLPACCLLAVCSCWVLLSSEPLRVSFFRSLGMLLRRHRCQWAEKRPGGKDDRKGYTTAPG